MRVPIIQSWTSNTNDDVGVCWLLSLLYATRRSRMSHGEADVDLHAMRTLHARCRPASCVSFFFFFFSHTLFLCSFQVVGKRHPPRYDWLGCFIFSFFEGGGTNSNNNNSYNNKNKRGESLGGGEHAFIATVHTPMTKRVVTPFTLAMHSHVAVHLGTQVLRLVLQVALVDATTFLQTKANDRNADEI